MEHEVMKAQTLDSFAGMRDTVHPDTILKDETYYDQVLGWAEGEDNPAVMPARIMLEFLHEWLSSSPLDEYSIAEISLYPSESPSHKRGDQIKDEQETPVAIPSFRAYPNPFEEGLVFETSGLEGSYISIYDLRGVLIDHLIVGKDQKTVNWESAKYARGIYLATLVEADNRYALKIVKH